MMEYYFGYVPVSKDKKLGGLAATYTAKASCPTCCPFHRHGCYGESGSCNYHNIRLNNQKWGVQIDKMALYIRQRGIIGQPVRLNVIGDVAIPGTAHMDRGLVENYKRIFRPCSAVFGYSHCRISREEGAWLRSINTGNFCMNLSCESVERAVNLFRDGLPAVLAVKKLSQDSKKQWVDIDGVPFVKCPYQSRGLTCAKCKLCMQADRKCVVVFEDDTPKLKKEDKGFLVPFLDEWGEK